MRAGGFGVGGAFLDVADAGEPVTDGRKFISLAGIAADLFGGRGHGGDLGVGAEAGLVVGERSCLNGGRNAATVGIVEGAARLGAIGENTGIVEGDNGRDGTLGRWWLLGCREVVSAIDPLRWMDRRLFMRHLPMTTMWEVNNRRGTVSSRKCPTRF